MMGNFLASVIAGSVLLLVELVGREVDKLEMFIDAPFYIRLLVYVLILLCINLAVFYLTKKKKLKDKLRPIYRVMRLNLDKWEGINNETIKARKKSEIGNIYNEINKALEKYYSVIMEAKKFEPAHLAAHNAIKEFTKFPEAGIQPELFQKAKKALLDAFPKEKKIT